MPKKSSQKRAARKEKQLHQDDVSGKEKEAKANELAAALFQSQESPPCQHDGDVAASYGAFDTAEYYARAAVPSNALERELMERSRQAQCNAGVRKE